jgi:hypothetical protein
MANPNDKAHLPASFSVNGSKAVFADFSEANYYITYDMAGKKAAVRAEISFETLESGYPIFDSVEAPTSVSLDGKLISAVETKTPQKETTLRVLNSLTAPGAHKMIIEVPLILMRESFLSATFRRTSSLTK